MASGQAEVVLGEVSKDDLSTGNVFDSALPWLTVPQCFYGYSYDWFYLLWQPQDRQNNKRCVLLWLLL